MSNSKKDNLEDAAESAPKLNENGKHSKFNKTKSISEVFSKLELSEDFKEDSVDESVPVHDESDEIIPVHDELDEIEPVSDEFEEIEPVSDEFDEIVPIHNEYGGDGAYSNEISEGGLVLNPVDDEGPQEKESDLDAEDSLSLESDLNDDSEAVSDETVPELSGDDVEGGELDHVMDDEKLENAKPSSQGVIINSNTEDEKDSKRFDSSFIFSGISFVVGFIIFIYGLVYYTTASDRVVDNVLSGETAGMAVIIIIIGLIIVVFSILSYISSRKSSNLLGAFNDIRSIDYDEIKNDSFSRDDFESAFINVFKKDKKVNEDGETSIKDESEDSVDASASSLFGSLRKGKSDKSPKSDENPENSSSNKFKSADDFDSYIEPVHMEDAQDTIFNNSDNQDESVDDFDSLDDVSLDIEDSLDDVSLGAGDSLDDVSLDIEDSLDDVSLDIEDSLDIGDSSPSEASALDEAIESEPNKDIGIKSRVVDEDAGFEVFVPDSDAIDVDAIKEDSIHKFKKSLNLDDILDKDGED